MVSSSCWQLSQKPRSPNPQTGFSRRKRRHIFINNPTKCVALCRVAVFTEFVNLVFIFNNIYNFHLATNRSECIERRPAGPWTQSPTDLRDKPQRMYRETSCRSLNTEFNWPSWQTAANVSRDVLQVPEHSNQLTFVSWFHQLVKAVTLRLMAALELFFKALLLILLIQVFLLCCPPQLVVLLRLRG